MASQMDEMDRDAEPVRAPRTTIVRCQPLRFVPGRIANNYKMGINKN